MVGEEGGEERKGGGTRMRDRETKKKKKRKGDNVGAREGVSCSADSGSSGDGGREGIKEKGKKNKISISS